MKRSILLTGATGALGSELLRRLVLQSEQVLCLVRGKGGETPHARIARVLGDGGLAAVVEGDICEPLCGVSASDLAQFRGRVRKVVHAAASISFGDEAEAEATNIRGVQNVLDLADALGATEFHHVSTAYVCGKAPELSEDDNVFVCNMRFSWRNEYERTKQHGEELVRVWARSGNGRRFSIYRPSILIGREDGTTPTFDAYYGYFLFIHLIAEAMRETKRKREELPEGVDVDENGVVDIPLVLSAAPDATLNLVPIDWAAEMMTKLFGVTPENRVYHLVNPHPPLVRWVINTSLAHLGIRTGPGAKIRVVESGDEQTRALGEQPCLVARLQRQRLHLILKQYHPYTSSNSHFYARNAAEALGEQFRPHRAIDDTFLGELLAYAVRTNWGVTERGKKEKTAS